MDLEEVEYGVIKRVFYFIIVTKVGTPAENKS